MRFLVRSRWSILLTFRNLIDRAPSDNRAGRCEGCSSRRRVPSFFHQRINAGSARLIVITSSAQCSPTETVESDISIWVNGDFSIWRLQTCFADPMLWNIHASKIVRKSKTSCAQTAACDLHLVLGEVESYDDKSKTEIAQAERHLQRQHWETKMGTEPAMRRSHQPFLTNGQALSLRERNASSPGITARSL